VANIANVRHYFFYDFVKHIFYILDGCPCDGCTDCFDCKEVCLDPESNENTQGCIKLGNLQYDECMESCGDGTDCMQCFEDLDTFMDNCPCKPNCPGKNGVRQPQTISVTV